MDKYEPALKKIDIGERGCTRRVGTGIVGSFLFSPFQLLLPEPNQSELISPALFLRNGFRAARRGRLADWEARRADGVE